MVFPRPLLIFPSSIRTSPPNNNLPKPPKKNRLGINQLASPEIKYADDGCMWSVDYGLYFNFLDLIGVSNGIGRRTAQLRIEGRRPFCTPTGRRDPDPPALPDPVPYKIPNIPYPPPEKEYGETQKLVAVTFSFDNITINSTVGGYEFESRFVKSRLKITDIAYPEVWNNSDGIVVTVLYDSVTTYKYSLNPANGSLAGETEIYAGTESFTYTLHPNNAARTLNQLYTWNFIVGLTSLFVSTTTSPYGDLLIYLDSESGISSYKRLNIGTTGYPVINYAQLWQQFTNDYDSEIQWAVRYDSVIVIPLIPDPGIDPPPIPKRKKEPDMTCCPEHDRLLKLVLKRVGDLPASVPTDLTIKDSPIKQINSLAEYQSYCVKQLDSLIGQFPLEILIEDADITAEGEQEQRLIVPNLSEAIGEILNMLLLLRSESDANLNATMRTLIEGGQTKQTAQIIHDYVEANSTFLGYKGKFIEKTFPMMFTPGEEQLDKILKETEIKLKTWEFADTQDLGDLLIPLLEFAAMWKAQNFRNLGTATAIEKLTSIFNTGLSVSDKLSDINPEGNDFDAFTEQVENGFISQPGVSDTTNPYGKEFSRRPRVREVGTDTSD